MQGIRLVSFDVTNTLIRLRVPLGVAYQQACMQYGMFLDADQLSTNFKAQYRKAWNKFPNFGHDTIGCRQWWSAVVSGTLHESGFESSSKTENEKVFEKIFTQLYDSFSTDESWTLDRNALEVLEKLKKNDQQLIVISNTDDRLESILTNLRIRQYFDVVINSYEAGAFKPQKEIFDLAISLTYGFRKCLARQAVHIGDDLECDFNGARAAGWYGLLLDRHNRDIQINKQFQLRSLLEIPAKLKTMQCS